MCAEKVWRSKMDVGSPLGFSFVSFLPFFRFFDTFLSQTRVVSDLHRVLLEAFFFFIVAKEWDVSF